MNKPKTQSVAGVWWLSGRGGNLTPAGSWGRLRHSLSMHRLHVLPLFISGLSGYLGSHLEPREMRLDKSGTEESQTFDLKQYADMNAMV